MNNYLDYEASLLTIKLARTGLGCQLFNVQGATISNEPRSDAQLREFDPRCLLVPSDQLPTIGHLAALRTGGFKSHFISAVPRKLTRGSFMQVNKTTFICSPALCLVRVANSKRLSTPKLTALAMEFAGSYSTAQVEPSLEYRTFNLQPIVSISQLTSVAHRLRKVGLHGSKQCEAALTFAIDNSGSYMETVLALALSLPPRYGGLGLPAPQLNPKTSLSASASRVADRNEYKPDIYWPSLNLDIEYDGKQHENDRERAIDRRRQNDLIASGMTILRAGFNDISSPPAFLSFEKKLVETLVHLNYSNARRLKMRLNDLAFINRQYSLVGDLLRYDPIVHPQPR